MHREIGVIMLSSGLLIPLITTNITNALNIQTVQIFNGQIGLYPRESQGYTFYVPTGAKNNLRIRIFW
jgi:hypothetical protein